MLRKNEDKPLINKDVETGKCLHTAGVTGSIPVSPTINQALSNIPSSERIDNVSPSVLATNYPKYGCWPEPHKQAGQKLVDWFNENFHRFIYPPYWIISNAKHYSQGSGMLRGGVYFLLQDNKIRYVGQSYSVSERLNFHYEKRIKEWNSFWCFGGIPKDWVEQIESFYIHTLQPEYNRKLPRLHETVDQYTRPYMDAFGLGEDPDLRRYWR